MVAIGMSVNIWGFGQVHVQLCIQVYFIDLQLFWQAPTVVQGLIYIQTNFHLMDGEW